MKPFISADTNIFDSLKEKYPNIRVELYVDSKKKTVYLTGFIVPVLERGKGIGRAFMEDLNDIADQNGYTITLTPSDSYGGNVNRLKQFYSSVGFVPNAGKYKDFSHKQSMHRFPKGDTSLNENVNRMRTIMGLNEEVEELNEYIRHRGNKWVVISKKGKTLGTHDTKEDALSQLRAIEVHKHMEEASIGPDGQLIGLDTNIFDKFPEDVLETLKSAYGHMYQHNFDWNSKSDEFVKDGVYDGASHREWLKKNEEEEFIKNFGKILSAVRSDLITLKKEILSDKKLEAFEELIKPVFGQHISTEALTKFEQAVIMDPNATLESIQRGFEEAKDVIDQHGNIDSSKLEKSTIFTGGDVSIPKFEKFVQENPEYKKTYDTWRNLFDEHIKNSMLKLNADHVVTYEPIRKLYDFLVNHKNDI
jgi:predicted GNAT family acetyltransferase